MDAFTHFFFSLAFWNILLATLSFLFGLLMGHWMWGQFKRQLLQTKKRLAENEGKIDQLTADSAKSLAQHSEQLEESNKKLETTSTELKASRAALMDTGARASLSEKKVELLTKKEKEAELSLIKLNKRVKELKQERDEVSEKHLESVKKQSESEGHAKEYLAEKKKLAEQLSNEKNDCVSLREVIARQNGSELELKKQVESLEAELAKAKASGSEAVASEDEAKD